MIKISWPDQEGNQPVSLWLFLMYYDRRIEFPNTNFQIRNN